MLSLSIQVYEYTSNTQLGGNPVMALHPVQGIERGVGGEDSSILFCYMLNTRGAYHLSAGLAYLQL